MTIIVAGGAGFVAANILDRLAASGESIVAVDNLSRGRREYIDALPSGPRIHFIQADLADREACLSVFTEAVPHGAVTEVWHFAANSDIPAGVANPDIDHKDTFLTTFELLRAMKQFEVKQFFFASSSAVYGDLGPTPLHEDIGPLLPISNYGAMKLAAEAQASAAAESHLDRVCLFRFPNVVGVPATHGVILDFIRKLKADPSVLQVLGNGSQKKAYLHVSDLVDAMLFVREQATSKVYPINIGPIDEGVLVRWIAEQVVARVCPGAHIQYGTGRKGWMGDVPQFHYSTKKLGDLGWRPTMGSEAALRRAIDEIATQEGL